VRTAHTPRWPNTTLRTCSIGSMKYIVTQLNSY